MSRRPIAPLLVSLLTSAALLASLPAAAADLLQAYRDAQTHDAAFATARATAEAGREKAEQGRAGVRPQVNATASVFNNHTDTNLTPSKTAASADARLSLVQPLYSRQAWIGRDSGELASAQAAVVFEQAKQDLILRVVEAYFAVLNAHQSLVAIRSQKTAIGQQLELAKKSFEVGTATITDTYEAQARYDLATAQEAAAENALEVARQALAAVVGKDPGTMASLRAGAPLAAPQPADLNAWVASAEKNNVQVKVQQLGAELAAKAAESARSGHHPTVDFQASYGLTRNDAYKDSPQTPSETSALSYGVQLRVPLYTGGATDSKVRETASQRDAALAALNGARRQAGLSARQAYLGVVNGLAQVRALEAAEVSSQSALDATKVGYEVGVRINNDVLNAEQQLYATKRDLFKARLDTLLAQFRLKAAVGTLSEDDVRQSNALLAQ